MEKTSEKLHEIRVWYLKWKSKKVSKNDQKAWDDIVLELREIITPDMVDNPSVIMDRAINYLEELERRSL